MIAAAARGGRFLREADVRGSEVGLREMATSAEGNHSASSWAVATDQQSLELRQTQHSHWPLHTPGRGLLPAEEGHQELRFTGLLQLGQAGKSVQP